MSKQEPLNLEQLGESYEIIGELAGRDDARTLMAKRRADGVDVLMVIGRTPAEDQGNALTHLAADANRLASLSHRSLLPILEGRWVGTDAFAIVMQRTQAPTLHELLSRRDEEFGFPRIAAILREANGVLEWAREQKVVHRAITPKTLFVESGSDRVCVSFAISPLPANGTPGADADGRCIAGLAHAMLTRSPAAPERADLPLAELRPGLPARLVEETEALLQSSRATAAPDVTAYIAHIAMAEALKSGEMHLEETSNTIQEQQRVHREQIETDRREHEQQLAAERKEHERQVAEQAKKFAKEREAFERELAKERKALDKEREALAKERASHAKDCAALARERAAYANDQAARGIAKRAPIVARRPHWNQKWNVPAAATVLALLIAVTAWAVGGDSDRAARSLVARATAARVVDSAGGSVYKSVVPLPEVTTDTAALAAIASDWTPPPRRRPEPVPRPTDTLEPQFIIQDESSARRDSVTKLDTLPKRDTTSLVRGVLNRAKSE